jgi:hypothetical protein
MCCSCSKDNLVINTPVDGLVSVNGKAVWVDVSDSNIMAVDLGTGRKPYIAYHGNINEMSWPLVTTNGTWILFSTNGVIKAVQCDDQNQISIRSVKTGYCPVAVWRDPQTSVEWAYYLKYATGSNSVLVLYRFMLADPTVDELVWDKTPADYPFSLSEDGMYGAGQFPWPNCGLIKMEYTDSANDSRKVVSNGSFFKAEYSGCNSNVLPDMSDWMFHVNAVTVHWKGIDYPDHFGICMFKNMANADSTASSYIPISIDGRGVHRVRATNDPKFVVFCGPMVFPGTNTRRDIFVGQFNSDCSAMLHSANISNTPNVDDASPYAWLASGINQGGPDSVASIAIDTGLPQQGYDSLSLSSPIGGASYRVGDTVEIEWSDPKHVMVGAVISLSIDNGKSWAPLTDQAAILPGSKEWGDYYWVIPMTVSDGTQSGVVSPVSNECMVQVSDYNNLNIYARSGAFSIGPAQ